MNSALEQKLAQLPDSPGCYMMKSGGKIIYVGKAINLKNRVRQYFHATRYHTPKELAMIEKIDDFDIVLVGSELEALALECNLIKLHRPKYNILLRDDKHYPYIRIDLNQPFPEVELVRRQESDKARYFGPYKGATVVREVLDVVRMVFPVRSCSGTLTPGSKKRPCIHYQIGQCLGPCAGLVSQEEYMDLIRQVMDFLNGNYAPVLSELKERMLEYSNERNYERAAVYRDRIRAVESVMQRQQAISTDMEDRDVLAVVLIGKDAMAELMMTRSGRLIGSECFVMEGAGDESLAEVVRQFIMQYYNVENPPPKCILVSDRPEDMSNVEDHLSELRGRRVELTMPMRGERRRMVDLARKNLWDQVKKHENKLNYTYARTEGAVKELQKALGLISYPRRIEAYDISNTQGVLSVGSMTVMIDGQLAKKEYRQFRIKTVSGANDFASMREVIYRRISHGLSDLEENVENSKFAEFPDLILIDGGRGQLNAALDAMNELGVDIPAFGLAKRIDEIILPDRPDSLLLDRHSNALYLVQRLRDEAHRFAITQHRKLRGKRAVTSILDGVAGVGAARKKAILNHFKTVEALKSAGVDDIMGVPGIPKNVAENVYAALHAEDSE